MINKEQKNQKTAFGIMGLVVLCCVIMAIAETIIEPAYFVKSITKAVVFLLVPFIYGKAARIEFFDAAFALNGKRVVRLLLLGSVIYAVIFGAYTLTAGIFDYSALVDSLSADQKVDASRFPGVALYISFGNSFLEEFLFRFIAFIKLSKYTARTAAYLFSSLFFAVYHIAMIGTSFPLPLLLLALIGLTAGGLIFDYVDERSENVYPSWIVHMFADFAIMTIWYLHI